MRERERLEDFRGGYVACRTCKRLIMFMPGELLAVRCCDYLYSPEQGPVDLVIYDRIEPGEALEAQVAAPVPVAVIEDEAAGEGEEPYDDTGDGAEIDALAASAETIEERRAERIEQVKRRTRLTFD